MTLRLIFIAAFHFYFSSSLLIASDDALIPKVEQGSIDFGSWDFKENGPVDLDGKWLFAPGQVFDETEGLAPVSKIVEYAELPKGSDEQSFSDSGYALYALQISGLSGSGLGIQGERILSAAKAVFVDENGQVLGSGELGRFSTSKAQEIPINGKLLSFGIRDLPANLEKSQTYTLILQVSNHHYPMGGPWGSVTIGDFQELQYQSKRSELMQVLMMGVFLVMGIYHWVLFMQRRGDLPAFFFSVFTLVLTLRIFSMGVAQSAGLSNSIAAFYWLYSFEYMAMPLMVVSFAFFIHSLTGKDIFKKFALFLAVLAAPLVAMALFAKPMVFASYLNLFQLHIVFFILTMISGLVYYATKQDRLALGLLGSFIIAAAGAINDMLHAIGMIQTSFVAHYTTMIFIVLQAGVISLKNLLAHERSKKLAQDLQTEINEKKELQLSNREMQGANEDLLVHNKELQLKQSNYREMLGEISLEYANASDRLTKAKDEQTKVKDELSAATEQLIQFDKFATMGTMVAGVAHDIANPNGLITLSHEQACEEIEKVEQLIHDLIGESKDSEAQSVKEAFQGYFNNLKEALNSIQSGSKRIAEINAAVRNQARSGQHTDTFLLYGLLSECHIITRHKLKKFKSSLDCPADFTLMGQRGQLGQVFMNLLSNAADAAEERVIREGGEGQIRTQVYAADGLVFIEVEDSGYGVPEDKREQILAPFFTTKKLGIGTGLGMPIIKRIVEEHKGRLEIGDSIDFGGALFRVILPGEQDY